MNHQQILEKAITKAIDGGLTGYWKDRYQLCLELGEMEYLFGGQIYEDNQSVEKLIFNHDFAKALWPGKIAEMVAYQKSNVQYGYAWQYHLQQMVIADEPIEYLGKTLEGARKGHMELCKKWSTK